MNPSLLPFRAAALALSAGLAAACVAITPARAAETPPGVFDVRAFGAAGDGKTLDTAAVNRAIAAAHEAGGGTVVFTAGTYACRSIRLRSNVALLLGPGSTILAADPPAEGQPGGYDDPEPNPGNEHYEDFGHSHFHNSLIWGEGLRNIAITGPGRIFGAGLSRGVGRKAAPVGDDGPRLHSGRPIGAKYEYPAADTLEPGVGNKAIALKNCRGVLLRDFTILHGGHFGILATGVDDFTIENLTIDTNRDGMDIDSCQNVRIADCTVNSPLDDGICLKSDYALGFNRPCENITITGCQVSGFAEGTLLDGTRRPRPQGGTGRIKFGTESNGGFINIAITGCVFESCEGLALETVDGAHLEDVVVSNLAMRDIFNAPIFLRLGARLRGPAGQTRVGTFKRVTISNVVAHNVTANNAILVAGLKGAPIEGLTLSHIRIDFRGGGTAAQAGRVVPEFETAYPDPGRFGVLPAYGLWARHVAGLEVDHLELSYAKADLRPAVVLDDVADADFDDLRAEHEAGAPIFSLKGVAGFAVRNSPGVADCRKDQPVAEAKL